jgi:hypothetical protein
MPESRLLLLSLATSMILWSGLSAAQQQPTRATPKTSTTTARPAADQTRDPFIGVWKLNPQTSKYESGGPPKSLTRTYENRGGGTIFMTTDVVTGQGTVRAYLVYKRDGKPYPEAAVGAESIRLVTVRSIDPRTEELFFIVDGKTSDKPSTITISADGMTMTQVVTVKNAKGQPFTNTVVYDKQP